MLAQLIRWLLGWQINFTSLNQLAGHIGGDDGQFGIKQQLPTPHPKISDSVVFSSASTRPMPLFENEIY